MRALARFSDFVVVVVNTERDSYGEVVIETTTTAPATTTPCPHTTGRILLTEWPKK